MPGGGSLLALGKERRRERKREERMLTKLAECCTSRTPTDRCAEHPGQPLSCGTHILRAIVQGASTACIPIFMSSSLAFCSSHYLTWRATRTRRPSALEVLTVLSSSKSREARVHLHQEGAVKRTRLRAQDISVSPAHTPAPTQASYHISDARCGPRSALCNCCGSVTIAWPHHSRSRLVCQVDDAEVGLPRQPDCKASSSKASKGGSGAVAQGLKGKGAACALAPGQDKGQDSAAAAEAKEGRASRVVLGGSEADAEAAKRDPAKSRKRRRLSVTGTTS